ncbi:hypothetical protein [Nocardia nova]|uniref:hypothetical protein n=1 Tax=Nocardia nova TaxID=37330 RepID=UPI0011DD9204|nr:hypothetical protein [Nocardia nova]
MSVWVGEAERHGEHLTSADRRKLRCQRRIDEIVEIQRRALTARQAAEDSFLDVVEGLSRSRGARASKQESRTLWTYFLEQQVAFLRDVAIAEHDFGKRLLIAARPLIDDASFATLWLALRNSGKTPRVRIRGARAVEFGPAIR